MLPARLSPLFCCIISALFLPLSRLSRRVPSSEGADERTSPGGNSLQHRLMRKETRGGVGAGARTVAMKVIGFTALPVTQVTAWWMLNHTTLPAQNESATGASPALNASYNSAGDECFCQSALNNHQNGSLSPLLFSFKRNHFTCFSMWDTPDWIDDASFGERTTPASKP